MLSQVDSSGRPRDGFVGLRDIYGLDLAADLVVLSGCQTALGREIRGEASWGSREDFSTPERHGWWPVSGGSTTAPPPV